MMEIDVSTLNRIVDMRVAEVSRMMLAEISAMLNERSMPIGREGNIQGYNATNGTVTVLFCDSAAIVRGSGGPGDLGDAPAFETNVPLITNHHGDQAGPIGGERCIVIPIETGYAAHIIYDEDDSPNAPAGERWITHRDPTTGVVDCYVKLTNGGGLKLGFGALSEIETIGGHSVVLDDNAEKITITSAGGLTIILDDKTGTIQLAGSGDANSDAIERQSDVQTALTNFKAAMMMANVPNAGAITVPTVSGSEKSFTA